MTDRLDRAWLDPAFRRVGEDDGRLGSGRGGVLGGNRGEQAERRQRGDERDETRHGLPPPRPLDPPAAAALPPPKPANWTSEAVQKEADGELFWKISNGRGAMPPWKHLPEKDRWELVNYIRSLKGK